MTEWSEAAARHGRHGKDASEGGTTRAAAMHTTVGRICESEGSSIRMSKETVNGMSTVNEGMNW